MNLRNRKVIGAATAVVAASAAIGSGASAVASTPRATARAAAGISLTQLRHQQLQRDVAAEGDRGEGHRQDCRDPARHDQLAAVG